MVRSAATPRVSNHAAADYANMIQRAKSRAALDPGRRPV
jgi:hypothetical protein